MPMDEAKYDTARLIAEAQTSENFDVADIVQEFLDQEHPERTVDDPAPEVPEQMAVSMEEEELVPQNTTEMADVIAQVLAATVGMPQEVDNEIPEAPAVPVEVPEPVQEAAPEPEVQTTQPSRAVPNVKTVQNAEIQKAPKKKGSKRQKKEKPPVGAGAVAVLGEAVSAVRAVQRADLPSARTSLRAAEKSFAMVTRISGFMAPLRYIILLLMAFSLGSRKYAWMSLGFLGGASGVYMSLFCTLLVMVTGWQCILKAMRDVTHLRFTVEPLLLLTTVLSLLDTAIHKDPDTLLPLLAMAWCAAGTSALMTSRANGRALRAVITGRSRKAVRVAADQWEHTDCIGKASASTAGFVRRLEEMDPLHSGWCAYSVLLLAISLIVSAYLAAKTQGNYFSILVTLLTVATPVSLIICCARPYELLVRALNGAGAPAGWGGIRNLSGKKAMLIYDDDLFPKGTIGHQGVRVYGSQTPELLASYAASLVLRADNGLRDVFTRLLQEMNGRIYDVSYFQLMDAGMAGRINGAVVAVGTYNFMQLLGAMPAPDAPKSGIYIAINGELAGVFAVRYRVRSGATGGFARLTGERSMKMLIATKNFCVNPSFLRKCFKVPVAAVACPKLETRLVLAQPGILARGVTCGFVMLDGIMAYSRLVAGSRRIHRMGVLLTAVSVGVSMLLMIKTAMAIAAGVSVMGGAELLLWQIIWFLGVEVWARIAVR